MSKKAADAAGPARQLGLAAAIALVMGNMIGSGVFLLPASLAPYGWNAVGGWVVTIAGVLVLAWLLARLSRLVPEPEGATGFIRAAFGRPAAFVIGFGYLVSIPVAVVTIAVAAVSYLSSMVPFVAAGTYGPAISAMALVWAVTVINLRGIHAAGHFQIATLLLKVIPLIVVILLAAGLFVTGTAEIAPFRSSELGISAIGGAAALTLWALLGFECASLAAARVEDPEVNVPRATMWGTGLTGLLYLLVCSAIALMLPTAIAANSPAPFSAFVARYWSAGPAALVAVFAVISCVGALNGWVLLQAEMARSMAERGTMPRWFARTDAAGTPCRALLVGAAVASVFLWMNASRTMQGLFEFLLLLSTSAALWFYLAIAAAAWKLKVARGFALAGTAYSLGALWGGGLEASALGLVLFAAALPVWWWMKRENALQPASADGAG